MTSRLSRLICLQVLLFVLLTILPLIYFDGGLSPYETPKYYTLLFIIPIIFVFSFASTYVSTKKALQFFYIDSFTFWVTLFVIGQLIANIVGLDPHYSIIGSEIRYQGFITLFLMSLLFISIKNLHIVYKTHLSGSIYQFLILSNALVIVYATYQIVLYYLFSIPVPLYLGRIVGTLGNPSFLGGFIAMTIPFLLFWKPKQKIGDIIKIGLIILNLGVLISTESRAAFLAVCIIGMYIIADFFHIKIIWRHCIALILVLIVFGAVFISSANLNAYSINRINGTKTIDNTLLRDSYWNNRGIIWHHALESISKRPIFGYGQENFSLLFPAEQQLSIDHSHNIFLEVAIDSGIIGLLLFGIILWYAFTYSSYVVQLSLVSFLVIAQFNPVSVVHILYFWILIALAQLKLNVSSKE